MTGSERCAQNDNKGRQVDFMVSMPSNTEYQRIRNAHSRKNNTSKQYTVTGIQNELTHEFLYWHDIYHNQLIVYWSCTYLSNKG